LNFIKFIAILRLRFSLGIGIIGMFTSVIGMLTFAKVWEQTFVSLNIPLIFVYIALPVGFFSSCWFIGYIYDVKGLWKAETSHTNTKLNPEFVILYDNIKSIVDTLDETNKKLEEIKTKMDK
jgi:hypothetical protein